VFKLVILDIKTTQLIFQEIVSNVVLPGDDGEISILDFHQPIISCLKNGIIKINSNNSICIKEGIAKMKDNKLVVLVEK